MIQQGTPEWFELRRGKVTGSMITAVLAEKANTEATTRKNYRFQLALERLTGVIQPTVQTSDMLLGKELEYKARGMYEGENDVMVHEVPFIDHPTIEWLGASPDGRVGESGLVEIKCPKPATHMEYLLTEELPDVYSPQVALQMMCTGAEWCDFVSYCPIMPPELQYSCVRCYPNPRLVNEITLKTIRFLAEVKSLVEEMEMMIKDKA